MNAHDMVITCKFRVHAETCGSIDAHFVITVILLFSFFTRIDVHALYTQDIIFQPLPAFGLRGEISAFWRQSAEFHTRINNVLSHKHTIKTS